MGTQEQPLTFPEGRKRSWFEALLQEGQVSSETTVVSPSWCDGGGGWGGSRAMWSTSSVPPAPGSGWPSKQPFTHQGRSLCLSIASHRKACPPPHGLLNLMLTSLISETVAVIVHQALFIFVYLRNKKLPLFFLVRLALVYV